MKKTWAKWTPEQNVLLADLWKTQELIKKHLHLFDDRPERTVIAHAYDLGLGKRPQRGIRKAAEPSDAAIRKALGERPMDSVSISVATGLSRRTVLQRLKALHESSEIHVSRWEQFGTAGYPARVWMLGKRKDAKRPTKGDRKALDSTRHKRDRIDNPDRHIVKLLRRRIRAADRAGTLVRRDEFTALFFGAAT